MATGTAGTVARVYDKNLVHYFRKSVTYADTGIGTDLTVLVGTLPAGALISSVVVYVTTAFNGGSTNVLTLGTTTNTNNIMNSSGVDETSATAQIVTFLGVTFSADTPLYVKYVQTGTPATTGAATILVTYIPNNDL